MNIEISKSNKKDKKLTAVIDGKKTIHFGDSNYSDFTKHKDEARKERYIDRHKKMKTGGKLELILLVFILAGSPGTNQPYKPL